MTDREPKKNQLVRVSKEEDRTKAVDQAVKTLSGIEILVGIPRGVDKDLRERLGATKPITNSDLGFIHEKGSPGSHIPPRPFLVPGVKRQKKLITEGMLTAARAVLKGNDKYADAIFERLGLQIAAGVKDYMQTADFQPLKPATIANRHKQRGTAPRPNEVPYVTKDGVRVKNPEFGVGIRPLINTAALRNAIDSYVIKGKK